MGLFTMKIKLGNKPGTIGLNRTRPRIIKCKRPRKM